jgi:hypothetical protein
VRRSLKSELSILDGDQDHQVGFVDSSITRPVSPSDIWVGGRSTIYGVGLAASASTIASNGELVHQEPRVGSELSEDKNGVHLKRRLSGGLPPDWAILHSHPCRTE